jgi:hypothetical protein
MLRRDYIMRMIEEFSRGLAKILDQKRQKLWPEAQRSVEEQISALTGTTLADIMTLSDTELLGCLLKTGEATGPGVKALLLARLLLEAADSADAQENQSADISRALRLKALHLLLFTALRGDVYEWPESVPTIDLVVQQLGQPSLPLHTQGLLMQHFERTGQFARAEDALFALIDSTPDNPALRELGLSFYSRLRAQRDAALDAGDLPRAEDEAGLEEFESRTVARG